MSRIAVIGAGAWGTALAHVAATAGNQVSLIGRDRATIDAINKKHRHPSLGEASLDARITARTDFEADADAIILAVPAQETRAALSSLASGLAGKPVILSAKGLENSTGLRQSEILAKVAPAALPLVLSGPSFAADVAASKPTAVTLAAHDAALADRIAALLAGPAFRPYAAGDIAGVEIAGAVEADIVEIAARQDGHGQRPDGLALDKAVTKMFVERPAKRHERRDDEAALAGGAQGFVHEQGGDAAARDAGALAPRGLDRADMRHPLARDRAARKVLLASVLEPCQRDSSGSRPHGIDVAVGHQTEPGVEHVADIHLAGRVLAAPAAVGVGLVALKAAPDL